MEHWSAERFRRADAVFDAALDLTPNERAPFVERACAGDAELCADVERLLRAHDRSDGFLSVPAPHLDAALTPDADPVDAEKPTTLPERIGQYRIVREIGHGGMGVVYLAERVDPDFRQRVALKVLRATVDDRHGHTARFLAERQLLVSLEHPHIARLFDGGVTADGLPYYTMAYCEGGSLAERLHTERALPLEEALRIARQLAGALGAAHARGIIHRDVKPANVLFDADGSVRLTDFGIAKLLGDDVTRTGDILGTVAYLSPEQAMGTTVDHRADLWALGATMYEMLSGQRPFRGSSSAAVLHAIVSSEPEPLSERAPGIPAHVHALVRRLLQKDPALRPESAAEVLRALDVSETRRKPIRLRRRSVFAQWSIPALVGGAFAVVVVVAGWFAWKRPVPRSDRTMSMQPADERLVLPSVAVRPFVNTSGVAADEPFTDGLTDELIGTFGKVRTLRVIARSSVFALKGQNLSARAFADTLGVDHVLEGSVSRAGDRARVSVQLVRARDGSVLWSEDYERDAKDAFAVQQEIARAVTGALRARLIAGIDISPPSKNTDARELYLKGRFALNTRTGASDLRRAVRYFEQAIARDSTYAAAYSGLSDAYASIGNFAYAPTREAFAHARAAALRALALDSTLAEARTSLAHTLCVHDFAWDASEREFRRAIAEDPGYTFARMAYGICLLARGRYDEAIAQLDTASQLDPLRSGVGSILGRIYVCAGRADDAVRVLKQTIDLNPQNDLAWEQLGHAYLLKGMAGEAIAALRQAAALSGVRDSGQLAYAYAVTGDRATAERIVRDLVASSSHRYVPPVHIAMAYSGLGRIDDAFQWLEQAYDERASFLNGVKVMTAFAPLHGDPRWARLLARMGLDR